MFLHREETLKKVLAWKVCSLSLTLTTLWAYIGSAKDAALLTLILHAVFIVTHRLFEAYWGRYSE